MPTENHQLIQSRKSISPNWSNQDGKMLGIRMVEWLSKQSELGLIMLGLLVVGLLGIFDRVAENRQFSSMLHLVPIILVTWFGGIRVGIITLFAGTLLVQSAYLITGSSTSYWNTGVRLGSFLVFVFFLTALRWSVEYAQEFGRTDFLTGVANRKSFTELGEKEISKARRYNRPFTVIYIDLDDFKIVNDRFGHSAGDKLLRSLAQAIRKRIRATDLVARLGGDEFGVLLPETDLEMAELIVRRLQGAGAALTQKRGCSVSFSMGVVTFLDPPGSVDEMLSTADKVMYTAKKSGKHTICREIFFKTKPLTGLTSKQPPQLGQDSKTLGEGHQDIGSDFAKSHRCKYC